MKGEQPEEIAGNGALPWLRCADDAVLYDYTMRPYAPPQPTGGKLHSSALLAHVLRDSPHRQTWRRLVDTLRQELGVDRTVWGLKLADGELSAELYFYLRPLAASSRHREAAAAMPQPLTADEILAAIGKVLDVRVEMPADVPAMMISVDVDDATLARGAVDVLHVYMMSGLSYDVTASACEHANHYTFFEMDERDRLRALVEHLGNGLLHGSRVGFDIQEVLIPQLYSCRTICLAAKRSCEGVYFAGIDNGRLRWFVEEHDWPESVRDFVIQRDAELDHLLWDVGLDYTHGPDGVTWAKRAFYGTF